MLQGIFFRHAVEPMQSKSQHCLVWALNTEHAKMNTLEAKLRALG